MLKVVPNGRTLNWRCQGLEVDLARTKAFTFNSQMSEVIFMSKKWHLGVQQGNRKKGWTPAAPAQKALPGWGCRSWKVGPRGPQRGSQGRGHSSPFRAALARPVPPWSSRAGPQAAGAEGAISIALVLEHKTESNRDCKVYRKY